MTTLGDYVTVEPWQHQNDAFDFLKNRSLGALFADMGTGKSLVAIGVIGSCYPANWLIVCPLAMVNVWAREFEKFAGYEVDVVPLTGPTKDRAGQLKERASTSMRRQVFITNYESLVQGRFWDVLSSYPFDGIILDESHRIKSPSAQITKKLTVLGRGAFFRYILTGTPAADKPIDVFSQYRFLSPSIFGTGYTSFRNRYTEGQEMINKGNGGRYYQITGYRNLEELNQIIYSHAFRVTNEVLQLPETTDTRVLVDLEPKARKVYDRMAKESVVLLDNDEAASAANVLSRLLRLQQITSGFLQADEMPGQTRPPVETVSHAKIQALTDLLTDIGDEPVVVFYRFSHDAVSISKACSDVGRPYYELSGRVNLLGEWKEGLDPGRVIAVQIRAGGSGVSTVEASKVVYYSNSYSLTDWQQSRARSHRPGQDRPVSYYTLVAKGTIDEVIEDALNNKEVTTRHLIDGLRRQLDVR